MVANLERVSADHLSQDVFVPFHELENIKLIENVSVTEGGRKIWNKNYIENFIENTFLLWVNNLHSEYCFVIASL